MITKKNQIYDHLYVHVESAINIPLRNHPKKKCSIGLIETIYDKLGEHIYSIYVNSLIFSLSDHIQYGNDFDI